MWEGSGKWLCSAGVQKYIFSKGADAWKETIQVSTWHHNQSYYCIWKQLSSSQIYKLLAFGITCIYCTCKCLNILHFHISMYSSFKATGHNNDHKKLGTSHNPGHNKPCQLAQNRKLPKTYFNFQTLMPIMYTEWGVIKYHYLHFRCFCYLILPENCLFLYPEYVKHPLLQNILVQFILINPDRAKVHFFINKCHEN